MTTTQPSGYTWPEIRLKNIFTVFTRNKSVYLFSGLKSNTRPKCEWRSSNRRSRSLLVHPSQTSPRTWMLPSSLAWRRPAPSPIMVPPTTDKPGTSSLHNTEFHTIISQASFANHNKPFTYSPIAPNMSYHNTEFDNIKCPVRRPPTTNKLFTFSLIASNL